MFTSDRQASDGNVIGRDGEPPFGFHWFDGITRRCLDLFRCWWRSNGLHRQPVVGFNFPSSFRHQPEGGKAKKAEAQDQHHENSYPHQHRSVGKETKSEDGKGEDNQRDNAERAFRRLGNNFGHLPEEFTPVFHP